MTTYINAFYMSWRHAPSAYNDLRSNKDNVFYMKMSPLGKSICSNSLIGHFHNKGNSM